MTRRERARALCLCPLAAALVACSHHEARTPSPNQPFTAQAVRAAFTRHGIRLTPFPSGAQRELRARHVLASFFGAIDNRTTASVLVFESASQARQSPPIDRNSPLCRVRCANDPRLTARHERLLNVVVDSLYVVRPGRAQKLIDAALHDLRASQTAT